jgi:hypothetical protein
MTKLDRRHLLAALGVGLMTARRAFAASPSQDIAQRLVQAQEDGKVDGLHTLLDAGDLPGQCRRTRGGEAGA